MQMLLDDLRPQTGERDRRGWEWYYLHSLCHMDKLTIQTHAGAVSSIAQSPDGKRIASGSVTDNAVRIWDASTGEELVCLRGPQRGVSSVSWCGDGETLASGGWDGTLIIWDLNTRRILHEVNCGTSVLAVAWRPDDQAVAVGGFRQIEGNTEDGTVWIVDGKSGAQVRELTGHVGLIWSLAWDPTGTLLAAGENWQGFIQVWEPETARLVSTFKAHNHYIGALAWSPDGKWLASGSQSAAIRIFNTADWSVANDIPKSHLGRVNAVCWSSTSDRLASFGLDGVGKIRDTATNSVVATIRGHQGAVTSAFWSRNEDTLVTGSSDGTIKVWNVNEQTETRDYVGRERVAWSPNGKCLAIRVTDPVSGEEMVRIVNSNDGSEVLNLRLDGTGFIGPIAFSPDGGKLAVGVWRPGRLIVWDLETRQIVLDAVAHGFELRSVDWSPDGTRLVTGGEDGLIQVWDTGRLACVKSILGYSDEPFDVDCVIWNPAGTKFASSTRFGGVNVWDAETYTSLLSPSSPKYDAGGQYPLSWSPSGDRLAIGCSGGEIFVIDAVTGKECYVAVGNSSIVRSVAWSPDGTRLASGGWDRQLKIWDASNGRELFSFTGKDEPIDCVAWAPEGRRIAIARSASVEILDATNGYASEPYAEAAD